MARGRDDLCHQTDVPLLDMVDDRFSWDGDNDLDIMLTHFKKAIET